MTSREHDLLVANRYLHKRLKAANRRADGLFVELTEAARQIGILREAAPATAAALDMENRAATLASTAQALVNQCGKFSRFLGDAAKHGQALLDSASAVPAPPSPMREFLRATDNQEART